MLIFHTNNALPLMLGAPIARRVLVLFPGTILIIELDPLGGIYNNAPPCRQCGQALVRVGVARAVFSCDGGGLHQRCFRANPDLDAPSLALALQCDAFVKVDVISKPGFIMN